MCAEEVDFFCSLTYTLHRLPSPIRERYVAAPIVGRWTKLSLSLWTAELMTDVFGATDCDKCTYTRTAERNRCFPERRATQRLSSRPANVECDWIRLAPPPTT